MNKKLIESLICLIDSRIRATISTVLAIPTGMTLTDYILKLVRANANDVDEDLIVDLINEEFERRTATAERLNKRFCKEKPRRHGESWSSFEDSELKSAVDKALESMAKYHGRTAGAIRSRIQSEIWDY